MVIVSVITAKNLPNGEISNRSFTYGSNRKLRVKFPASSE